MNSLFLTEADSGLYFVFQLKTAVRNTILVQKRQIFPNTPAQKLVHNQNRFARYTLPGTGIFFCHFISGAQLSYFQIGWSVRDNRKLSGSRFIER